MQKFCAIFILVCCLAGTARAQTINTARVKPIPCPVVADMETGLFSAAPRKYICLRSGRDARRAGFKRFQFQVNALGTPIAPTSCNNPTGNATPAPTATPTPTPAVPDVPPTTPGLYSFSIAGTGGGVSKTFAVTSLPGSVSFSGIGSISDRFQIYLRDASTGYMVSQLTFNTGVFKNTAALSKKGVFYLEVKATGGMNWAITANYR